MCMKHTVRVCHLSAPTMTISSIAAIADANALEGTLGFLRWDDFSGPQDRRVSQRQLVYTRGFDATRSISISVALSLCGPLFFFFFSTVTVGRT